MPNLSGLEDPARAPQPSFIIIGCFSSLPFRLPNFSLRRGFNYPFLPKREQDFPFYGCWWAFYWKCISSPATFRQFATRDPMLRRGHNCFIASLPFVFEPRKTWSKVESLALISISVSCITKSCRLCAGIKDGSFLLTKNSPNTIFLSFSALLHATLRAKHEKQLLRIPCFGFCQKTLILTDGGKKVRPPD